MPKSFDEYAEAEGIVLGPGTVIDWFDARPDLIPQIAAARSGRASWDLVVDWLREEHDYPFKSSDGLRSYLKDLS